MVVSHNTGLILAIVTPYERSWLSVGGSAEGWLNSAALHLTYAGVEETKETNDVVDEQLKAAAISDFLFFFKGNRRIFNSDLTALCFIVPFVMQTFAQLKKFSQNCFIYVAVMKHLSL